MFAQLLQRDFILGRMRRAGTVEGDLASKVSTDALLKDLADKFGLKANDVQACSTRSRKRRGASPSGSLIRSRKRLTFRKTQSSASSSRCSRSITRTSARMRFKEG